LTRNTRVNLNEISKLDRLLAASIKNPGFCSTYVFGPNVTLNISDSKSPANTFFLRHGPFIKSLFLDSCNCTGTDLFLILYNHCPHLEELCLVESGILDGICPLVHVPCEDAVAAETSVSSNNKASSSSAELEVSNNSTGSVGNVLSPLPNLKAIRVNLSCTRMIRNTKLMSDLLKISPNVERISWIRTCLDEFRYDRNFQLDLERAWCNNLVQYQQARPNETGTTTTIRDTICDVAIHSKDVTLSRLSRIESNMRLSNESIKVLQERKFPLQYLNISLTMDVEQSVLYSLLQSLAKTLTTLKLEFISNDARGERVSNFFDFVFPPMPRMKHLFVQKFPSGFSFRNNFTGSKFPALKSLSITEMDFKEVIEEYEDEWEDDFNFRNDSLTILQLTCNYNCFPVSSKAISNLAKFFPNVYEIRIDQHNTIDFDAWSSCFRKLKRFAPPSDKLLGGLPSPRLEVECYSCCSQNQNQK